MWSCRSTATPQSSSRREARWVGDHGEAWLEQVFAEHPGSWIADRARDKGWRRIGVSGLDYVIAVRDYRALADGPAVIVPFDEQFDLARAVKSAEELESVREGMRINEAGVEAVLRAYELGKTEAELMGEAERVFTAAGCYRTTMDMILGGPEGGAWPEFKFPSAERRIGADDLLLYGLEVAGPGGHWVEFSRPICAGKPSADTLSAIGRLPRVRRGSPGDDESGRDGARRPHGRLQGLPRARFPARPRHWPLDRHDHDRAPEDRRGQRDRAAREHGRLHAPARDHAGRARLPVHAGHVAGHARTAACPSRTCRSGSTTARRRLSSS